MITKKIVSFAVLCLWALGTIGGIGYALYGGSVPCAIGCALNAALAFPTVKKAFKTLTA